MKLALAQMSMSSNMEENYHKILSLIDQAQDCDLLFFPEIQFSPFFPQYPHQQEFASQYIMTLDHPYIQKIQQKAKDYQLYISPNIYLSHHNHLYDCSLMINDQGVIVDQSYMVHILQAKQFYEEDYYAPSPDGFKVYSTPFGNIGIVICFDRHMSESIRTCALKGADLILIPTANITDEPLQLFEAEIQVQAYQNQTMIAMCNRVGQEGEVTFAGESLVVSATGETLYKANDKEQLIKIDLDLNQSRLQKEKVPFLKLRKTQHYL